jgi:hypothetical protein
MTTALEVLNTDVVETSLEVNITKDFLGTVKSVVVSNELSINEQAGAVVTLSADRPDTGFWALEKAFEDSSDVVCLSTSEDCFISDLVLDVREQINLVGLTIIKADVVKLFPGSLLLGLLVVSDVDASNEVIFVDFHWGLAGWWRVVLEGSSWHNFKWEFFTHASQHLDGGTTTALEELDADVVPSGHEFNFTSLLLVTVKSIVVSNELLIDVQLGTIVTDGTDCPPTGGWNIDKAVEDSSDVVFLSTGQDHARTSLVVDIL